MCVWERSMEGGIDGWKEVFAKELSGRWIFTFDPKIITVNIVIIVIINIIIMVMALITIFILTIISIQIIIFSIIALIITRSAHIVFDKC